ncbi:unnamed protein product [Urochloa humidicola]
MGGLTDLDFRSGLKFQDLIKERFSSSISFSASSSSPEFWLVCSFGRSTIQINVDSMSLILQSVLRGVAKDFRVQHLSNWMFRFSVNSKAVGFAVCHLKSVLCSAFNLFFALWGNGGPNWIKEYNKWCEEQDSEWTHISRKAKKNSYADVAKRSRPSVFSHLNFQNVSDDKFKPSAVQSHSSSSKPCSVFKRLSFKLLANGKIFSIRITSRSSLACQICSA